MQRFVLAFTWKAMPNVVLAERERETVEQLIEDGQMEQILLAEDRSRGWLVVQAANAQAAEDAVSSLPFYPSMQIETTLVVMAYP